MVPEWTHQMIEPGSSSLCGRMCREEIALEALSSALQALACSSCTLSLGGTFWASWGCMTPCSSQCRSGFQTQVCICSSFIQSQSPVLGLQFSSVSGSCTFSSKHCWSEHNHLSDFKGIRVKYHLLPAQIIYLVRCYSNVSLSLDSNLCAPETLNSVAKALGLKG